MLSGSQRNADLVTGVMGAGLIVNDERSEGDNFSRRRA